MWQIILLLIFLVACSPDAEDMTLVTIKEQGTESNGNSYHFQESMSFYEGKLYYGIFVRATETPAGTEHCQRSFSQKTGKLNDFTNTESEEIIHTGCRTFLEEFPYTLKQIQEAVEDGTLERKFTGNRASPGKLQCDDEETCVGIYPPTISSLS